MAGAGDCFDSSVSASRRIQTRALSRVPRGEWGGHTVGELMRTDLSAIDIFPQAGAIEAMNKIQ